MQIGVRLSKREMKGFFNAAIVVLIVCYTNRRGKKGGRDDSDKSLNASSGKKDQIEERGNP